MNIDLISLLIFFGLILFLLTKYKSKFVFQGKIIALYKTKIGLKLMNKIARKWPRLMNFLGIVGIIVGFSGMVFIFSFLIKETFAFVSIPGAQTPLAPVLPGINIPGAPNLSFWHWIIAIFFVATVHEFAHGIQARLHNIKIKSSGVAFFGPILAAFVEPNEKELAKKSKIKQLSILAAGPFSNMLFGIFFLLIFIFLIGPITSSIFMPSGIVVNSFVEGFPAENSSLELPFTITEINGISTVEFVNFIGVVTQIKPDDDIELKTDQGKHIIIASEHPENNTRGFIGISDFEQKKEIRSKNFFWKAISRIYLWFSLLIFWLFVINIGVGLFNLLPLGIVDGGRMFFLLSTSLFKKEKIATRLFHLMTWICLLLIIINLFPWLIKLVLWIFNGFSFLINLF